MTTSAMPTEARAMKLVRDPSQYPEYVDRWAIIVGVSQYQHEQINLKYAHRDAEELYELIQTPSGGGFAKEHIVKLTDEEATTAKITKALRSFLKKPARDDIVLIYFACHGSPDPDRPDIVYLITHDTDPSDISGTALPMREIDLCLKENLLADRVILIADTCHSAAIGGKIGRRSTVDNSAEVNRYLQELSGTRGGVALLTSAEASETSQEGKQWGGGHGVFTHYLLEGMRGAADREPKNGTVSVGELFDYVREQVQKATGNAQHPSVGPNSFDRRLPVAITGGVTAQEQYRLGCQLFELGRLLNDQELLSAARTQLQQAIHLRELNHEAFPTAKLAIGRIELFNHNYPAAIAALQDAAKDETTRDALYYLGVALASQGNIPLAYVTLERYLPLATTDPRKEWGAYLANLLHAQTGGRFYVLIIGVNFRSEGKYPGHLRYLHSTLIENYGVQESDITTLIDEEATYAHVLQTFSALSEQIKAADTILVYYSGDALPEDWESCLQLHDTRLLSNGTAANAISADELHNLMNKLPTKRKTLSGIMPNRHFLALAHSTGSYALFTTAALGQSDHRYTFDDGVNGPLFGYSFVRQLRRANVDPQKTTYSQLITEIQAEAQTTKQAQTPLFVGDLNRLIFSGTANDLNLLEILEQRNYATMSLETIRSAYQTFQQMSIVFPEAHYRFGRALIEKRAFAEAMTALEYAQQQQQPLDSDTHFALALAHLGAENYTEAVEQLQQYLHMIEPAAIGAQVQTTLDDIRTWAAQTPVVLIGIDHYAQSELPTLQGAVNDVLAMKALLMARYGFRETEITVLLNEQATYKAMTEAFARVAQRARTIFGLFFFAGLGSETTENIPTILSHDGRQPAVYDISLPDLAAQTSEGPSQLLTIIDAGWAIQDSGQPGSRTVATDTRPQPMHRAVKLVKATRIDRNLSGLALQIGRVSIYNSSLQKYQANAAIEQSLPVVNGAGSQIHGYLTHLLLQRLAAADRPSLTYGKLAAINQSAIGMAAVTQVLPSLSDTLKTTLKLLLAQNTAVQKPQATTANSSEAMPVFIPIPSHKLLSERVMRDTQPQLQFVDALLTLERIELTNEMVEILKRMIEQRNDIYPEGNLYLGVAYMVRNEYEKAIETLDMALTQRDSNFAVAHYYLGRTLFVSGKDLARAESELRIATQQAPENIAAYYFLGQAIRRRVEQEKLVEAENALRKYREGGAPLGDLEDVDAFLRERKPS